MTKTSLFGEIERRTQAFAAMPAPARRLPRLGRVRPAATPPREVVAAAYTVFRQRRPWRWLYAPLRARAFAALGPGFLDRHWLKIAANAGLSAALWLPGELADADRRIARGAAS